MIYYHFINQIEVLEKNKCTNIKLENGRFPEITLPYCVIFIGIEKNLIPLH